MEFEVLRCFCNSTNEEIFEIRYLDDYCQTNKMSQWFYQKNDEIINLTLKKIEDNEIEFEQGTLLLIKEGCIFNGLFYSKVEN